LIKHTKLFRSQIECVFDAVAQRLMFVQEKKISLVKRRSGCLSSLKVNHVPLTPSFSSLASISFSFLSQWLPISSLSLISSLSISISISISISVAHSYERWIVPWRKTFSLLISSFSLKSSKTTTSIDTLLLQLWRVRALC